MWAQKHLPLPIFLILAVLGLCLLGWALVKWAPSQTRSDASERIALQKNKVEFEQMTRDEIDKKLEDEATEVGPAPPAGEASFAAATDALTAAQTDGTAGSGPSGGAPDASNVSEDSHKAGTSQPADSVEAEEVRESSVERSRRVIEQIRYTENQVAGLFETAFEGPFAVEREIKIASGTARGRVLDILLDPKDKSRAQLGVEVKWFGAQIMSDRLSDFLMRLAITTQDLSAGTVFTGMRGRPRGAKASGVLVLVVKGEGFAANAYRVQRHISELNSALKRSIGVVIATPEGLERMQPGELRDAVASLWAEPDKVVNFE
ncbi:hypothetical protein M3666_12090 [Curtobacterium sp. ODYSSEY 48 V2]|uniref:hypothetical protein n=1 Tax=Curtobacterium sp. ODYSSEY 48 V2 TaxID=2939561 RepID=UPI00203E3BE7|nr:hypothetical protein [Curtobacterium sp. ODYSSEY 48 V2]MCM3505854.1 hypothetical protein [Curtobacterium sp. ODYSSEY 48 V2]